MKATPFRKYPMGPGWHWFLCQFTMDDGTVWSFELPAQSHEDAETRLRCIAQTGKVDGRMLVDQIREADES